MTKETKDCLVYPAMASAGTVIFHLAGLRWSWAALIGFIVWPLLGTLVTSGDDDLEGGTPWSTAGNWGQICVGLSVVSFVAFFDGTWGFGWKALAAGVLSAITAGSLLRRADAKNSVSE